MGDPTGDGAPDAGSTAAPVFTINCLKSLKCCSLKRLQKPVVKRAAAAAGEEAEAAEGASMLVSFDLNFHFYYITILF